MHHLYRIIFLFLLFVPFSLEAQNEEDRIVNHQLWLDYNQYSNFKHDWQFYGDAGARTILEEWSWLTIFARASVRWKKHKLYEVHGGFGVFQTFDKEDVNTLELRPWQGFRLNWPRFKSIKFNQYVRLEERFNFLTDDWTLETNLRIRYKIGLNILVHTFSETKNIFVPFSVEFFGNVGPQLTEKFTNQSRVDIGVGYKLNSQWIMEFHFVNQFSRTGDTDEFKTSDRIYTLKLRRFLYNHDYHSNTEHDDIIH